MQLHLTTDDYVSTARLVSDNNPDASSNTLIFSFESAEKAVLFCILALESSIFNPEKQTQC